MKADEYYSKPNVQNELLDLIRETLIGLGDELARISVALENIVSLIMEKNES